MEDIYDDLTNYEDVNALEEVLWFSAKTFCHICLDNINYNHNIFTKYPNNIMTITEK